MKTYTIYSYVRHDIPMAALKATCSSTSGFSARWGTDAVESLKQCIKSRLAPGEFEIIHCAPWED